MAKALELKLGHEGFEALAVFNGKEGIEELKNQKYDIVLCDLVMPIADGFYFLKNMKAEGFDIPVTILTNLSQDEDNKKAIELGAKDVFVKSNTPISEIVDYVKNALK